MAQLEFTSVIEMLGINPYVLVGKSQAAEIKAGWRKPMPVLVQINGQPDPPWHINMMPRGDGSYYLYLHGEVRKASKTGVGNSVKVKVSFDENYMSGPPALPVWFAKPLAANTPAYKAWIGLSPSRQKEIARYLTALKSVEARQKNVSRTLELLAGAPGHFMGRDWKDGK